MLDGTLSILIICNRLADNDQRKLVHVRLRNMAMHWMISRHITHICQTTANDQKNKKGIHMRKEHKENDL